MRKQKRLGIFRLSNTKYSQDDEKYVLIVNIFCYIFIVKCFNKIFQTLNHSHSYEV